VAVLALQIIRYVLEAKAGDVSEAISALTEMSPAAASAPSQTTSQTTSGPHVARTYKLNRNGCFGLHLEERGFRKAEQGENAQVAYWDTYKVGPIDAQFDCWPRSCTNVLDCVRPYFQRVFDLGLAPYFPETLFDWRNLTKETIESSPVWFLKEAFGYNGRGITLIAGYQDYVAKRAAIEKQVRRDRSDLMSTACLACCFIYTRLPYSQCFLRWLDGRAWPVNLYDRAGQQRGAYR
jgi:hypothetical protein